MPLFDHGVVAASTADETWINLQADQGHTQSAKNNLLASRVRSALLSTQADRRKVPLNRNDSAEA